MGPLEKGYAWLALGLLGAGEGPLDIPGYVQLGALGVVVLLVTMGFRRENSERAFRAKEAHEDRMHRERMDAKRGQDAKELVQLGIETARRAAEDKLL